MFTKVRTQTNIRIELDDREVFEHKGPTEFSNIPRAALIHMVEITITESFFSGGATISGYDVDDAGNDILFFDVRIGSLPKAVRVEIDNTLEAL